LHLLEAVAAVPGRLLATLAPLLSALEELQPVAIGMVALCAVMMATCIVLVVGRDMRQPRWIEEGSR
jgi:membrane protein DedA with SNARE-associated domain